MAILNEKEYKIFSAAMSREEKVCRLLDDKDGTQDKGIKLVPICKSIKHKVKSAVPAKYAYWEKAKTDGKYKCSACNGTHIDPETGAWNEVFDHDKYAYCPNCGAKMEGKYL